MLFKQKVSTNLYVKRLINRRVWSTHLHSSFLAQLVDRKQKIDINRHWHFIIKGFYSAAKYQRFTGKVGCKTIYKKTYPSGNTGRMLYRRGSRGGGSV